MSDGSVVNVNFHFMPIRTDRALKHPKLTKNEPTTREKAASEFNTHPTGVNETAEKVRKNETPMSRASALQAVNFYSLKANDIAEFPITNTRRRDIVPTFCAECSPEKVCLMAGKTRLE